MGKQTIRPAGPARSAHDESEPGVSIITAAAFANRFSRVFHSRVTRGRAVKYDTSDENQEPPRRPAS